MVSRGCFVTCSTIAIAAARFVASRNQRDAQLHPISEREQ
jgi:hypothetical protein